MPGDELHEESAAAGARTGPRHAAPKKPLLSRLHVPAGKAIAIAAMPTAVLMGMGLTPQLAMAKPQPPTSPFKDGPCVTAPDQTDGDAKKDADKNDKDKDKSRDKDEKRGDKTDKGNSPSGSASSSTSPSTSPSPAPSSTPGTGKSGGSGSAPAPSDGKKTTEPSQSTSPSPSATPQEENPWYDPLGLGKKLHDVFTPGDKKSSSPGTSPSPSPSPSKGAPSDGAKDKGTGPGSKPAEAAKDPKDSTDPKDSADKAKDKTEETAKASPSPSSSATPSPSPSASAGEDPNAPDADGRKPFPCVVEKKVDGTNEQPPARIPNQPWFLEASSLTLKGADYKGVVNLTMPNGRTKQVLKYIVKDGTDIGDLHQIVDGPAGKKYHVQAGKGTTSTIRGGATTMYTESLSGKLFGLIPVTFDPEHPPPLNIPLIYVTDVKVRQAGQFGGTLTVPGLHNYITG